MLRHLKLIEQTIAATNIDSEPHRRWKLRRACSLSYSGLHPHGKLSFSRVPLVIMNYRKSYRGARGYYLNSVSGSAAGIMIEVHSTAWFWRGS